MKLSPVKTNNNMNFKSITILDMNYKFASLRGKLQQEIDRFSRGYGNVRKLGDGVGGECYRFNDSTLSNFVIEYEYIYYN